MNAWMPPMVMPPTCACRPPYQTMLPSATALMICTAGRNSADSQAAR